MLGESISTFVAETWLADAWRTEMNAAIELIGVAVHQLSGKSMRRRTGALGPADAP
jgi:hypothetical protein